MRTGLVADHSLFQYHRKQWTETLFFSIASLFPNPTKEVVFINVTREKQHLQQKQQGRYFALPSKLPSNHPYKGTKIIVCASLIQKITALLLQKSVLLQPAHPGSVVCNL